MMLIINLAALLFCPPALFITIPFWVLIKAIKK